LILLAANMKFHGTSPWYLFDFLCKAIRTLLSYRHKEAQRAKND
jgi:hypothetical protein